MLVAERSVQGATVLQRQPALPIARVTCNSQRRIRVPVSSAESCTNRTRVARPFELNRRNRRATRVNAEGAGSSGSSSSPSYDTVIVGGGIYGLVTAQALASKHGITNFLVTEARERVGGNITSLEKDGFIWEEGPNSFQPNDAMLQIAVDAGVDKDLVFGDPKAPRFVYWENKLRATPSGPDALTFDLLSPWGKVRAGLGAVGLFKAPMPDKEETVEQFIRRNLGDEVFERLIEPFCSGVYAGDPRKLSMKAAFKVIWNLEKTGGSLVGGAIKRMQEGKKNSTPRDPRLPPKPKGQTVGSFRKGLRMLTDAIGRNVKDTVRVNWKLASITRTPAGTFTLVYETPEGKQEVVTRSLLLTVPAYVAADLIQPVAPAGAEALRTLDYPPVAAVTLSYPLSAVRDDRKDEKGEVPGFGQLHPRSQGIVTLGTIYSSSLFPNRCPDGNMLVLNYIGGALNRNIVNQTPEQLVEQVDKDVRKMLMKPDAPKPQTVGVRVWPRAIPQFNVGHDDVLDTAKSSLQKAGYEGLFLGGNYVCGVALGKCVEGGYAAAENLAAHVAASKAPRQPVNV